MTDIRLAFRSLARRPGFAVTAIVVVALGLGTNAAILGVVDRVLIRSLPYQDPERLVWIASIHKERGRYSKSSGWDFDAWRERRDLFDSVDAYWDRSVTLTGTTQPEALLRFEFTPTLIETLGVSPALGRSFVADDTRPESNPVVILSDSLWKRRFAGDGAVVGRTLQLDGRSHTIVGVMPAGFQYPMAGVQLWTPLTLSNSLLQDRKLFALRVVARLRSGTTRSHAQSELALLSQRFAHEHPDTHTGWTTAVRPLRQLHIGDAGTVLWLLQGAAVALLAMACANVVSLVLVRATGLARETSIRLALGARRLRLFREHFAEGLLLALAGGAGGLALAAWAAPLVRYLLSTRIPKLLVPEASHLVDARIVGATAAATVAIAVLFGVAPLLRMGEAAQSPFQRNTRYSTADRRTRMVRTAIIGAQIALSVSLLVCAGLLGRSFTRLHSRTFGFATDHIVTAQLMLPRDRYPDTARGGAFLEQLTSAIGALPGVESAAAINTLPLTGFNALRPYRLPGREEEPRMAEFRVVTSDYFRVMQIPVGRGRTFDARDRLGSAEVVVVNERLARRLWPGADPIGQTLLVPDALTPAPRTVIGVVGDTRHHDLALEPEAEIYRPAYQASWPFFGLVVRSTAGADTSERTLREAAASVDGNVPISGVRPFAEIADTTWAWRRSSLTLVGVFAAAALFLAFIGVYGVMAHSVAQRTGEIGVRLALGARPADVARHIIGQGALVAAVAIVSGLGLAASLARLMGSLLFGVPPIDPLTFAGGALVAFAATTLAAMLPALAASRVDPVVALRSE
jgi:putative ABC transport system permease protein